MEPLVIRMIPFYPVDRAAYNRTIEFLNEAISQARLGHSEKLHAFNQLRIIS